MFFGGLGAVVCETGTHEVRRNTRARKRVAYHAKALALLTHRYETIASEWSIYGGFAPQQVRPRPLRLHHDGFRPTNRTSPPLDVSFMTVWVEVQIFRIRQKTDTCFLEETS